MSSMCTSVSHCVCVVWVLLAVVCLYIQIISPYIYIYMYIHWSWHGVGVVLGSFWSRSGLLGEAFGCFCMCGHGFDFFFVMALGGICEGGDQPFVHHLS